MCGVCYVRKSLGQDDQTEQTNTMHEGFARFIFTVLVWSLSACTGIHVSEAGRWEFLWAKAHSCFYFFDCHVLIVHWAYDQKVRHIKQLSDHITDLY